MLPQLGRRPIQQGQGNKDVTSPTVLSEPKTTYKNPVEEAEQNFKALRMQDQKDGSGGNSDS